MKRSIYEIQNPKDYEPYFTENKFKENLIQALANMGQRLGLKGDGIKYNSFKFTDLIDDESPNYNSDSSIGFIKLENGKINIGISSKKLDRNVKKQLISSEIEELNIETNINNNFIFGNEFTLEIPINNIEKYITNSILHNDSKYFTQITVGKYLGFDDNAENNCEYIYNKFDIETNELVTAYRIFHLNKTSTSDYYCLLKLKYNGIETKLLNTSKYILTFQIFDLNYLSDDLKKLFKNSFNYSKINAYQDENKTTRFNFLDTKYVDTDELEDFDDNPLNITSYSIVALILNHQDNKYDYPPQQLNYLYNTDKNVFFYETGEENLNKIANNLLTLYGINLIERVNFIVRDIVYSYVNMINLYNTEYYFKNRKTFLRKIICDLYFKIETTNNINFDAAEHNNMYIPLDYKFHYICNSEDEMEIYYSTNIFVNLINLYNEPNIKNVLDGENIIYAYNSENKVKVYNFEIDYNTEHEDIINKIQIKDLYTLPYINAEYNWSINDKNTFISALGKDAGNPNIIIVYSSSKSPINNSNQNNYSILNNIYNKDKILLSDWELRDFKVSKDYFTGNVIGNPKCYAYIPRIAETNVKYLYDSIIVSISSVNCLENSEDISNYNGKFIVTLWSLNEVQNNINNVYPQYDYLKFEDNIEENKENVAITFGTVSNDLSETDDLKNTFDILLLKAQKQTLAQEKNNESILNWAIVKNKTYNEYNQISNQGVSTTGNDLNFIIQYADTIKNFADYTTYETNESKFINKFSKDGFEGYSTDSKLYPKYIITETTVKKPEETYTESNILTTTTLNSKITITSNETISVDYIDIQQNTENYRYVSEPEDIIQTEFNQNGYYNEYVFGDNIPNLDLKEILLRNINTINRLNIISLDQSGKIYNSYLGSSFMDDPEKRNIFHIGSNNININIGSDTLIEEKLRNQFKKQDTLSIDFDNVILNTKTNIVSNNQIWVKQTCFEDNKQLAKTFYSTAIRPIGIYESYENSIFGYENNYIYNLLYTASNFVNKDLLKNQLSQNTFYAYREINLPPEQPLQEMLKSNEHILFLLNATMLNNEQNNKDSIFKRINVYKDDRNNVELQHIYNELLKYRADLIGDNKCLTITLTNEKNSIKLNEIEGLNFVPKYAYIETPNQINNVQINNVGDPIKVILNQDNTEENKITAVHYGGCMLVLAENKLNSLDEITTNSENVFVIYVNVDISKSVTLYSTININKLFKYKLGKDLTGYNIHINTKYNKLLQYADNDSYLILNNEDNLINIDSVNNIYYYDNELSIMYYENDNDIYIHISFERDNYTTNNKIQSIFNIIQKTCIN